MTQKRQVGAHPPGEQIPNRAEADRDEELRREIALRAYYRYCERGRTPGMDREDWLAAEQELMSSTRTAAD